MSAYCCYQKEIYCRVPARRGLSALAVTRHGARDPLVIGNHLDQKNFKKNEPHTRFALLSLRQGEPGTAQYICQAQSLGT